MEEKKILLKIIEARRAIDKGYKVLRDNYKKLGDFYFERERWDDAFVAYQEDIKASELLKDHPGVATAHRMAGEVLARLGNFKEAVHHVISYANKAEEMKSLVEQQRAYTMLGKIYSIQAHSYINESEREKRKQAFQDARKSILKSILACDKLNDALEEKKIKTALEKLSINFSFAQQDAIELIPKDELKDIKCKLSGTLYEINFALSNLHNEQGNPKVALQYLDDVDKIVDNVLRADALYLKSELLMKLGEWAKARKIVPFITETKMSESLRKKVEKLFTKAASLNEDEKKLLLEDDLSKKMQLYERMGDAAVVVGALDKAVEYYGHMLKCAEQTNSTRVAAALTSLYQTLRDMGKFKEAISYARRNLELCHDPTESCNVALFIARLLVDAKSPNSREIRNMFERAITLARKAGNSKLQMLAQQNYVEFLKTDANGVDQPQITERLDSSPASQTDDEDDTEESPDVAADIDLDELSNSLRELTTGECKNKNQNKKSSDKLDALVAEGEENTIDERLLSIEKYRTVTRPEKILASKADERTLANLQHPGRMELSEKAPAPIQNDKVLASMSAHVNDENSSHSIGKKRQLDVVLNSLPHAKRSKLATEDSNFVELSVEELEKHSLAKEHSKPTTGRNVKTCHRSPSIIQETKEYSTAAVKSKHSKEELKEQPPGKLQHTAAQKKAAKNNRTQPARPLTDRAEKHPLSLLGMDVEKQFDLTGLYRPLYDKPLTAFRVVDAAKYDFRENEYIPLVEDMFTSQKAHIIGLTVNDDSNNINGKRQDQFLRIFEGLSVEKLHPGYFSPMFTLAAAIYHNQELPEIVPIFHQYTTTDVAPTFSNPQINFIFNHLIFDLDLKDGAYPEPVDGKYPGIPSIVVKRLSSNLSPKYQTLHRQICILLREPHIHKLDRAWKLKDTLKIWTGNLLLGKFYLLPRRLTTRSHIMGQLYIKTEADRSMDKIGMLHEKNATSALRSGPRNLERRHRIIIFDNGKELPQECEIGVKVVYQSNAPKDGGELRELVDDDGRRVGYAIPGCLDEIRSNSNCEVKANEEETQNKEKKRQARQDCRSSAFEFSSESS